MLSPDSPAFRVVLASHVSVKVSFPSMTWTTSRFGRRPDGPDQVHFNEAGSMAKTRRIARINIAWGLGQQSARLVRLAIEPSRGE